MDCSPWSCLQLLSKVPLRCSQSSEASGQLGCETPGSVSGESFQLSLIGLSPGGFDGLEALMVVTLLAGCTAVGARRAITGAPLLGAVLQTLERGSGGGVDVASNGCVPTPPSLEHLNNKRKGGCNSSRQTIVADFGLHSKGSHNRHEAHPFWSPWQHAQSTHSCRGHSSLVKLSMDNPGAFPHNAAGMHRAPMHGHQHREGTTQTQPVCCPSPLAGKQVTYLAEGGSC